MDWRFGAACRVEDPELFFPVGEAEPARLQALAAKAVCAACSVNASCLAWALQTGQETGIWGGLDEVERRALRRRSGGQTRKRAPAADARRQSVSS